MKRVKLDNLFAGPRNEPVPDLDVTEQVMKTLNAREVDRSNRVQRSLLWFSVASSAAAAALVLLALSFWQQRADSIDDILEVVIWAAQ